MRAVVVIGLVLGTLSPSLSQPIPARPEALVFGELPFEVPDASRYRHQLATGVVVYIAEDHTFPLVDVRILLRQGSYLEPADKVGLAALTGALIRSGGSSRLAPDAFDEEVEFLAADLSSSGGDARAGASLRSITPVLEPSMDLFFDMLRHPRFDPAASSSRRRTSSKPSVRETTTPRTFSGGSGTSCSSERATTRAGG